MCLQRAYNEGLVIVRCYGCDNLHLIADRLNWFEEGNVDVYDLLKKYGGVEDTATQQAAEKGATTLQLTPDDVELLRREIKAKAEVMKGIEGSSSDDAVTAGSSNTDAASNGSDKKS